jgi:hypothetical protein
MHVVVWRTRRRGARGETRAIVHGVHLPVMLKRRGGIALTYSLPTLLHSSNFILSTSYGSRGDAEHAERHGRLSTVYIYRLCLSAVEESPLPIHFLHYFTLPTLYFRLHMDHAETRRRGEIHACTWSRRSRRVVVEVATGCGSTTKIHTKNYPPCNGNRCRGDGW